MSIVGALASYKQISQYSTYDYFGLNSTQKSVSGSSAENNSTSSDISTTDEIQDTATVSSQAINLYNSEQSKQNNNSKEDSSTKQSSQNTSEGKSTEQSKQNKSSDELTDSEKQQIAQLKITDAKVKAHENAHKAAAAGLSTDGPNYEYETGPDGKKYAVGGDVNVSYQHSSDPQQNLQNAQTLKAAALAPADPSSQDKRVASNADREIAKARQEILEQQNSKTDDSKSKNSSDSQKTDKTSSNQTEPTKYTETTQSSKQTTTKQIDSTKSIETTNTTGSF